MKLPDFTEFEPFNDVRERMGAEEYGDFVFFDPSLNLTGHERLSLQQEGLAVEDQHLRVGEDYTLVYKDSRILLLCSSPQLLTERYYHLADCATVAALRDEGLANSKWMLRTTIPAGQEQTYHVCADCLQRLSYRGFDSHRQRHRDYSDRIQQAFELQDYFERYPMYPVSSVSSAPVF